jgi:hypothetical protein
LLLTINTSFGQAGLNDGTRAVFIFDIAKYIDYGPGFGDSSVFRIGILDKDVSLFFEMGNVMKTRTKIQDKPVEIVKFNTENQITYTQVLYVNKASGYNLNKVKAAIEKHQTHLVVTPKTVTGEVFSIPINDTSQYSVSLPVVRSDPSDSL